jgi:hypothetical protein
VGIATHKIAIDERFESRSFRDRTPSLLDLLELLANQVAHRVIPSCQLLPLPGAQRVQNVVTRNLRQRPRGRVSGFSVEHFDH